MPKVNDVYFEEKRKQILDAAFRACMNKPLYEVTMKDIIEETGFSQGGIYRYYNNIHEIFFALVDRKTKDNCLREKTDEILEYGVPEQIMAGLIELIFLDTVGDVGKILFELSVTFANDPELYANFCEQVKITADEAYLFEKSAAFVAAKIEDGYFEPIAPISDVLALLVATIDGIKRDVIMTKYYKIKSYMPEFDMPKLSKLLTKQLILALGGDLKKINQLEKSNND
ncbi:MAG: TetR/AcrR family transcriptional regulator [Christensenellaceae bacterium]|jgi:AcrR family transcriptional regulator|nr:TetR/AcrR family transcriptional regulator [Christensenellaceae bacterium]